MNSTLTQPSNNTPIILVITWIDFTPHLGIVFLTQIIHNQIPEMLNIKLLIGFPIQLYQVILLIAHQSYKPYFSLSSVKYVGSLALKLLNVPSLISHNILSVCDCPCFIHYIQQYFWLTNPLVLEDTQVP